MVKSDWTYILYSYVLHTLPLLLQSSSCPQFFFKIQNFHQIYVPLLKKTCFYFTFACKFDSLTCHNNILFVFLQSLTTGLNFLIKSLNFLTKWWWLMSNIVNCGTSYILWQSPICHVCYVKDFELSSYRSCNCSNLRNIIIQ